MPKLPTALDLGPAPASPSRPVGTYDVSGFARGAQALAGGAEALGKGVSNVGADVAEVSKQWNESRYLDGSAGLRTDLSTLHNSLQNSKDYANLDSQWAKGSQQAVDRWAKTIPDGRLRQHFLATSGELVAHGAGAIKNLAFNGLAQSDADASESTLLDIKKRTEETPDDPMLASDMQGYRQRLDSAVKKGFLTPERAELRARQAGGVMLEAEGKGSANRTPLKFLREAGVLPRGEEALPSYWNKDAARRASGVNEDLMSVVKRASEISGVQFVIGDKGGTRDQATQDHLTGNAIDLIPIVNGKPNPDAAPEQYAEVNRAMKQASDELGLKVGWGGEWKSFKDSAHFELPKDYKPAENKYARLDPNTLARLVTHAQTVLHAREVDLQRIAGLNEAQHKQALTNIEDEYLKDSYSANPTKSAFDAASDPRLDGSPETKKKIISVIDRTTKPEPIARVSQDTTMAFVDRMRKPEGDPLKLTDRDEITDAYTKGQMSRGDYDWTLKQFDDARGGGDSYAKARNDFVKRVVEPQIMKSDISTGLNNTRVGQRAYEFEQAMDRKKAAMLKEGKNPNDMFDPTKPDYMGKEEVLKPLRRTAQRDMADMLAEEADQAGAGDARPAKLPAEPKAAKDLGQLQAMVRANPALRETAIQIATERGWVTTGKPKAAAEAPTIPMSR